MSSGISQAHHGCGFAVEYHGRGQCDGIRPSYPEYMTSDEVVEPAPEALALLTDQGGSGPKRDRVVALRAPAAGWQDGSMRRLLVLGSTVVFLDVVFYTAITPLLPGYVDDLGLSKSAAGVLTAAYAGGTL